MVGRSSVDTAEDAIMRSLIASFLLLGATLARPQFEVLKSVFSEVVGDIEQVPYTVLQEFDVSFLSLIRSSASLELNNRCQYIISTSKVDNFFRNVL